jgi:hypothetical protein
VCSALKSGACPSLRHLAMAYNWIGVLGSRAVGKEALVMSGHLTS